MEIALSAFYIVSQDAYIFFLYEGEKPDHSFWYMISLEYREEEIIKGVGRFFVKYGYGTADEDIRQAIAQAKTVDSTKQLEAEGLDKRT